MYEWLSAWPLLSGFLLFYLKQTAAVIILIMIIYSDK